MNLKDKPAFARPHSEFNDGAEGYIFADQEGMTLREYYAGLAMQGMLSMLTTEDAPYIKLDILARDACRFADALIAELEKEEGVE